MFSVHEALEVVYCYDSHVKKKKEKKKSISAPIDAMHTILKLEKQPVASTISKLGS